MGGDGDARAGFLLESDLLCVCCCELIAGDTCGVPLLYYTVSRISAEPVWGDVSETGRGDDCLRRGKFCDCVSVLEETLLLGK